MAQDKVPTRPYPMYAPLLKAAKQHALPSLSAIALAPDATGAESQLSVLEFLGALQMARTQAIQVCLPHHLVLNNWHIQIIVTALVGCKMYVANPPVTVGCKMHVATPPVLFLSSSEVVD